MNASPRGPEGERTAPGFELEAAAHPKPQRSLLSAPHTPYLEWRDAWTLDVGFMDEDHRALAARLNRLARDYGSRTRLPTYPVRRPDAPPLLNALSELTQHTREHFQREEEVMRTDGYPGLPDHKSEHEQLLAELSALTRELRESRRQWLELDLLDSLKDWFLGHVLELDRELADFLKRPEPPGDGGPGL